VPQPGGDGSRDWRWRTPHCSRCRPAAPSRFEEWQRCDNIARRIYWTGQANVKPMTKLRSDITRQGLSRTPHRAFMRAMGLDDEAIAKPMIGVVSRPRAT